MVSPVTLREYQPGDAASLAQLYFESVRTIGRRRYSAEQVEAWAPAPQDPAAVRRRAGDGRFTLLAIGPAGEVLGYGDLEDDGHVDHLYCSPQASGAGIAGLLLDALVARAQAVGLKRLHVEASELAASLFTRKGFTLAARRDFEVRGIAIHNYAMTRELEDS